MPLLAIALSARPVSLVRKGMAEGERERASNQETAVHPVYSISVTAVNWLFFFLYILGLLNEQSCRSHLKDSDPVVKRVRGQ